MISWDKSGYCAGPIVNVDDRFFAAFGQISNLRIFGKRVKALHFASNGREALHAFTNVQVDIVLMDIHMPEMDGIEATLAIRESKSPLKMHCQT